MLSGNFPQNPTAIFFRYKVIILVIYISSLGYLSQVKAQNETFISIKYGMVHSTINYDSDFYTSIHSSESFKLVPSYAVAIKHQIHPNFRLGIEVNHMSEKRNLAIEYKEEQAIGPIIFDGDIKRKAISALLVPEISVPGADWLYFQGGIGFAQHYENEFSYEDRMHYLLYGEKIGSTVSIPSGKSLVYRIGVGIQSSVNKVLNFGIDCTYFNMGKYGTQTWGTRDYEIPKIGFQGLTLGASLGIKIHSIKKIKQMAAVSQQ